MSLGSEFFDYYDWEIDYFYAIWNEAQVKIWKTKDGRCIPVEDMTTSHIQNTIAFLRRKDSPEIYQPWVDVFNEELERRKGGE